MRLLNCYSLEWTGRDVGPSKVESGLFSSDTDSILWATEDASPGFLALPRSELFSTESHRIDTLAALVERDKPLDPTGGWACPKRSDS